MNDLEEALRQVPLFAKLPQETLQWLAEHGEEIWLQPGGRIAKQGDPPDGFYIILDGKTEWTRTVGEQTVHAVTLEAGDVFAELILLLDEPYPTSGHALTEVHLYKLTPDTFWEMLCTCPSIPKRILKISAQRSQIHEAVSQQQAKLISLGTLSAGLAHELNNPATAALRGVQHLEDVLQKLPTLALKLHQQPITEEHRAFLSNLYQRATESAAKSCTHLDPLAQSEAEDEVTDWLDAHEVADGWKLAPTLVAAGLNTEELDKIVTHVDLRCLGDVLSWLEATVSGVGLLNEVKLSSTRISELITAMKDYSYMDQAPLQDVDIHEGIESTLKILSFKLKQGVVVKREYGDLPRISAYGRQLNQVWTNLIDNAIDATGGKGTIWIRTSQEGDFSSGDRSGSRIVVEIADDGIGIPSEIQPRIFEQFFTTKEVGKGTGLGLDIARRIVVGQHKGDIRVDSKPGDTRFQVRLPINTSAESATQ
jgi:signal transduction histidine kinase